MNKHVEGLREALKMWEERDCTPREVREKRAGKLALFGLFTAKEIAVVTGVSKNTVEQVVRREVNKRNERDDPMFKRNFTMRDFLDTRLSVLNPRSLDVLFLLAEQWKEEGSIKGRKNLILHIAENGTALYTISQLTGIPMKELREEIYGDPDDPGVV